MANIQKIDPETAAHNIATIFSKKYIDSQKEASMLSAENSEFYNAIKYAAKLYACAYDESYEFFSKENEMD